MGNADIFKNDTQKVAYMIRTVEKLTEDFGLPVMGNADIFKNDTQKVAYMIRTVEKLTEDFGLPNHCVNVNENK
jgi:ribosomal protein L30/L7E